MRSRKFFRKIFLKGVSLLVIFLSFVFHHVTQVDIDGQVVQLSAGDSHTVALTSDGRVFAWGTFR
jgi:alpha-tubulin suppressor-like RCC1 family protein